MQLTIKKIMWTVALTIGLANICFADDGETRDLAKTQLEQDSQTYFGDTDYHFLMVRARAKAMSQVMREANEQRHQDYKQYVKDRRAWLDSRHNNLRKLSETRRASFDKRHNEQEAIVNELAKQEVERIRQYYTGGFYN